MERAAARACTQGGTLPTAPDAAGACRPGVGGGRIRTPANSMQRLGVARADRPAEARCVQIARRPGARMAGSSHAFLRSATVRSACGNARGLNIARTSGRGTRRWCPGTGSGNMENRSETALRCEPLSPQRVLLTGARRVVGASCCPSWLRSGPRSACWPSKPGSGLLRRADLEMRAGDLGRPSTLRGAPRDATSSCTRPRAPGRQPVRDAQRRATWRGPPRSSARRAAGARVFVLVGYAGTVQERTTARSRGRGHAAGGRVRGRLRPDEVRDRGHDPRGERPGRNAHARGEPGGAPSPRRADAPLG